MTLTPGTLAPDFTLQTDQGPIRLSALRGRNVVLYFYPKDDTPGCTVEACSFNDNLPNFSKLNAEIIGVSPDATDSHEKFRGKFGLKFHLAADTDQSVAAAYGTWVEKNMYGRTYMGMERSTFLIGPDGKIKAVWRKVDPQTHTAEVLAALEGKIAANSNKVTTAASAKKPAAPQSAVKKAAGKKAAGKKMTKKKMIVASKKTSAKKTISKKTVSKKAASKKAAVKTKVLKSATKTRKPASKSKSKKR